MRGVTWDAFWKVMDETGKKSEGEAAVNQEVRGAANRSGGDEFERVALIGADGLHGCAVYPTQPVVKLSLTRLIRVFFWALSQGHFKVKQCSAETARKRENYRFRRFQYRNLSRRRF